MSGTRGLGTLVLVACWWCAAAAAAEDKDVLKLGKGPEYRASCKSLDQEWAEYMDEQRYTYYTSRVQTSDRDYKWSVTKNGHQPPAYQHYFHSVFGATTITAMVDKDRLHHVFCTFQPLESFWCDYTHMAIYELKIYAAIVATLWAYMLWLATRVPAYRRLVSPSAWLESVRRARRPLAVRTVVLLLAGLLLAMVGLMLMRDRRA